MKTERGYSLFTIKSVDEDKRTMTGIATTPATDRVGDIVEPKGAQFELPIPFLWQHDHSKPVGWVTNARVSAKGIEVVIEMAKELEPGVLKDRLDEAWQSIKSGLVRGLSIGFRGLESADITGTWGQRFTKWLWLELSAVTIPANGEASIQTVKSIDLEQRASHGDKPARPVVRIDTSPGASGNSSKAKPKPQEGNDMNIAEMIKNLEAQKLQKTTRLNEITNKAMDEGRGKDAAEKEEFDTLRDEVKAIDGELVDLRELEALNVTKATPVNGTPTMVSASAARSPATVKNTQILEPGIEFARFVMCQVAARGDAVKALTLAKAHYPQMDRVVKALDMQANSRGIAELIKADVAAGTTLQTTWAAPLVDYQNFAGDFVEYLRPQTIIGKFGTGGVPSLNRIPFNIRITGQTSGGSGYWVGEGKPKPLTKFDFNAVELRWAKVANIAVLTEELIRFSDPSAERLVRDALADALRARLDIDFIDPDKAAVANVSPASITNGVVAISSTGNTAAAIRQDLRNLWAPFIAANNPPTSAVYIMSATTALALSLMMNDLETAPLFPGLTMNGGTFNGVPVIVSEYLDNDGGSGGSIVILANARDIWLADDGGFTIDASREASLQMLDNPTNDSGVPTPTTSVSMFQTNSVAIRCERYINWQKRRTSAVAWLDGVNWGA